MYIMTIVIVAFLAFMIGHDKANANAHKEIARMLNDERKALFNALIPFALGSGDAAQVCLPVRRLAGLLGIGGGTVHGRT